MSEVGDILKKAREDQKLTIYQVAEITKIRSDHLRAIDEGNYDVFSAPVYIRGFVRTYANALKLDVKDVLAKLSVELAESGAAEPVLAPPSQGFMDSVMFQLSKLNWRIVVPTLVVLVLLGISYPVYMVWQRAQSQDPREGLSAGMYQPPQQAVVDTLQLPQRH